MPACFISTCIFIAGHGPESTCKLQFFLYNKSNYSRILIGSYQETRDHRRVEENERLTKIKENNSQTRINFSGIYLCKSRFLDQKGKP